MNYLDYVSRLRDDINIWLRELASCCDEGRFRFTLGNEIVPVNSCCAQMSTLFAVRIAWQLGLWELWSLDKRNACVDFIKKFQQPDGFFEDLWVIDRKVPLVDYLKVLLGKISVQEIVDIKKRIKVAETRQSMALLAALKETCRYPLTVDYCDIVFFKKQLFDLDWKNPWSAGSHFSHSLFFYANQRNLVEGHQAVEHIEAVKSMLAKLYDKETGTWYSSTVSDKIKINGAMKVLSGLQWVDELTFDAHTLMDFALKQNFAVDGCSFLNLLYVIYNCWLVDSEYRMADVREFCARTLVEINDFRRTDGGFSFFKGRSQTSYYGQKTSKGYKQSDLHGTAIMVWAISLAMHMYVGKPEIRIIKV